ncbi:RNA polymerase sigma factor [Oceaniglobus trochenteri]|uniref:RNA polymerase sigma factor n=1 Tax=Oceaniglobus trochenteri TaxID=2763260 RepID=UPI001CFFF7AD|nr:RNA polymerase sigma factor [Oceaniglobus trochenteri]
MNTTDEDLARAAATGDAAAFSALLERRYDTLFALCFRLTGTQAEAEDLTQDICLSLPARMAHFAGQSRFTTWLYRVAVNAAHDRRRRAASHTRAARGWGDWELARQAAIDKEADRQDWLQGAMARLPADLRDTLALTMDDDLTHAEAAEVLGISPGTVSWRLSEVRKRLREEAREEGAT